MYPYFLHFRLLFVFDTPYRDDGAGVVVVLVPVAHPDNGVGMAEVTISGKNKYKGTKTATFMIAR
jgi:hypothetical protein